MMTQFHKFITTFVVKFYWMIGYFHQYKGDVKVDSDYDALIIIRLFKNCENASSMQNQQERNCL